MKEYPGIKSIREEVKYKIQRDLFKRFTSQELILLGIAKLLPEDYDSESVALWDEINNRIFKTRG